MRIIVILILSVIYFIDSYSGIYLLSIAGMLYTVFYTKNLNTKIVITFLCLYYAIALIPGSTYRGEVSVYTLTLYSILCLLPCIIIPFSKKVINDNHNNIYYKISSQGFRLYYYHLVIVYIVLLLTIAQKGLIILNQESRFELDGATSYIIKSVIYFPLIHFISVKRKILFSEVLKFYFLPLFPALFIGSRGTVIMILFSLVIVRLCRDFSIKDKIKRAVRAVSNKRILILFGTVSLIIIVGFSYVRRSNSQTLSSTTTLIETYFKTDNPLVYVYFPFHIALREQIGITNYIIENELSNPLNYSMFIADMITILPGKQPSAGITLNILMTGNDHAGLTPGILGGIYLDWGIATVTSLSLFIIILNIMYSKSIKNEIWLTFYALSVVQFFHLFHRGFLKPEYIFAYLIVYIYWRYGCKSIILKRKKTKSNFPVTNPSV